MRDARLGSRCRTRRERAFSWEKESGEDQLRCRERGKRNIVSTGSVLDRDLDYAGASRIAKILPIRKKGELKVELLGKALGKANVAE